MDILISNWAQLDQSSRQAVLQRAEMDASFSQEKTVQDILLDIKKNKDEAVLKYTLKFDVKEASEKFKLPVPVASLNKAWDRLPADLKNSLQVATENIKKFHQAQNTNSDIQIETMPGVRCSRKKIPLKTVGLYIPGGSAPLFSTLLMTAIPAQIAKVKNIVVCSPPNAQGQVHDYILAACYLLNLTQVFAVGGVQAIGAMAYGTESIPQVDKIFGPGNSWVTSAKSYVAQKVPGLAIDMPAGPSEVLIIADSKANPTWLAWDLLSQLEHGPDSQAILISDQFEILEKTKLEVNRIIETSKRQSILKDSVKNLRLIQVDNLSVAFDAANEYASEHLLLNIEKPEDYLNLIQNAGSVFVGSLSPESVGDYASGTNHVLPTAGYAKSYSGLNLDSFLKSITFQNLSAQGLLQIAPTVETMAAYEGLEAHQMAVQVRRLDLELDLNKARL